MLTVAYAAVSSTVVRIMLGTKKSGGERRKKYVENKNYVSVSAYCAMTKKKNRERRKVDSEKETRKKPKKLRKTWKKVC